MSSWTRGLYFVLILDLHSYLMYASSDGSGEFAHMHIHSPEPSLLDNAAIICIQVKVSICCFIEKNVTDDIFRATRMLIQVQVKVNAPPPLLYSWHQ